MSWKMRTDLEFFELEVRQVLCSAYKAFFVLSSNWGTGTLIITDDFILPLPYMVIYLRYWLYWRNVLCSNRLESFYNVVFFQSCTIKWSRHYCSNVLCSLLCPTNKGCLWHLCRIVFVIFLKWENISSH